MTYLLYVAVGLLTAVEGGEVALFFAGYLLGTGELLLLPTAILIAVALFGGDFTCYYIGPKLYQLPVLRKAQHVMSRVDTQIRTRPFLIALLARFSYGMHHAIIARYKLNGIESKKMAQMLATTGLVWLVLLGSIVLLLAEYTAEIKHYMRYIEYAFASVFVVMVVAEIIVTKLVRKHL